MPHDCSAYMEYWRYFSQRQQATGGSADTVVTTTRPSHCVSNSCSSPGELAEVQSQAWRSERWENAFSLSKWRSGKGTMSKNPAAAEPGKGESKHHGGPPVHQRHLVSFNNANDFSRNRMVKPLQAPTLMTFLNWNKTQMFYLCISLQTSLRSQGRVWLGSISPPENVESNPICPSSFLHQRCRLVHGRLCKGGPKHRLRLFVCVFILARLSGLSDKTVKWSVPENQPCTIWWEKKKPNCYIHNHLYSFLGVGGHQGCVDTGLSLTNLMLLFLISVYDCGHRFSPTSKRVQIFKPQQPLVLPTLSICKYPQHICILKSE